jgi:hypothetical protein
MPSFSKTRFGQLAVSGWTSCDFPGNHVELYIFYQHGRLAWEGVVSKVELLTINWFMDGLSVFGSDWFVILIFIAGCLGSGLLALRVMPGLSGSEEWILPLSLGLGSVIMSVLGLGLFLLARVWTALFWPGLVLIWILVIAGLVGGALRDFWRGRQLPTVLFLAIGALLYLLLRLAYLKSLLLPPYYDSPQHYQIIQNLLAPSQVATGVFSLEGGARYYHFGFHGLAAFLAQSSRLDLGTIIPLTGQLLLTILPLPVFALVLILTADRRAAGLAALLAGIGWAMPAFGVNWGKYPALESLVALPAITGLLVLSARQKPRNKVAWGLAVALIVFGILVHTRLLVVLIILLPAALLAWKLPLRTPLQLWQAVLFSLLLSSTLIMERGTIFGIYCSGPCLPTWIVPCFLIFAFMAFPRFSLATCLVILEIFLVSNINLPGTLAGYSLKFLDRTYVDMLLFLPMSILGGLGLAGFLRSLPFTPSWQAAGSCFFVLMIGFSYAFSSQLTPDLCCNYVRAGDLQAIQWIATNTPPQATILVAAYRERNYMIGTDAGMWVHVLTGRNGNRRPYSQNWSSLDVLRDACRPMGEDVFVYSGQEGYSFDRRVLDGNKLFRLEFEAGPIRVYRLTGCSSLK